MKAARFLADFDPATAMARSLGCALRGRGFEHVGRPRPIARAPLAKVLPERVRERLYASTGGMEAISPERIGRVRAEAISRWVVEQYPERRYPALLVGSASGAAIHLAAALKIPWLPQTFLIPVRQRGVHPDEPRLSLAAALEPAQRLLEANPDLTLHHMVDPVQDRRMLEQMAHFRVKRLRLGQAYTRFIEEHLVPGGTLFVLEVQQTWPITRVGDRHVFQFGAAAGATPDEYHHGSARVEAHLARHGAHRQHWDPPPPDGEAPEAEWGFDPALRADLSRLAARRGYRVVRVVLGVAEDLGPLVADLYRSWYRQRGLRAERLLVESAALVEPFWALRTGSVPLWLASPTEASAAALERYLEERDPYDEIYASLFGAAAEGLDHAPPARWREILGRARTRGELFAADVGTRTVHRELAAAARHQGAIQAIRARYALPGPLSLDQLEAFLQRSGDRYAARFVVEPPASPAPPVAA